jgi:hypothetical protein
MTVVVAVETVLLVVLLVLVAGLLRSHAEILRRLGPGDEPGEAGVPSPPAREPAADAAPIGGQTLEGDAVGLSFGGGGPTTLLAFLSSGCETCGPLWDSLAERPEVPGGGRVVVVTKDTTHESPSRLRRLAPTEVPLVMSSAAWSEYEVPGSPYFVLIDGESGAVRGEGAATGWDQIASLIRDAQDDIATADRRAAGRSGDDRALRAERALSVAGIGPGHPSLYPAQDSTAGRGRP